MEQTSLNPIDAATVLVVLAAVFGYANHKIFKLPHTIGLTIVGARASLAVVAVVLSPALPRRLTTGVVVRMPFVLPWSATRSGRLGNRGRML